MSGTRTRVATLLAVAAMSGAILIFGSNFAMSRYAVLNGMAPGDVVLLRYGISGLLLLPVFARGGGWRTCAGVGWRRGALLALSSGAVMVLFMSLGLVYAPAAHGAALGPGTVTLVGVVYGVVMAGRLPSRLTAIGFVFLLLGLGSIAAAGSVSASPNVFIGDLCFLVTGLLWGFYPILLHRWGIGAIQGASICAVLSLAYAPPYLLFGDPRLMGGGATVLLVQVVFQGLINGIAGLWLWGIGVRTLGTAGTQLFPPMIPVVGALVAIPLLGEWPGPVQILGVAFIVGGLVLAAIGSRARPPSSDSLSTAP